MIANNPQDSIAETSAARWVQTVFYSYRMAAFPKTKMRRLSVPGYEAAEVLLSLLSPEEIEQIISWVFSNPFWSSLVVSVSKLVKFLPAIQSKISRENQ